MGSYRESSDKSIERSRTDGGRPRTNSARRLILGPGARVLLADSIAARPGVPSPCSSQVLSLWPLYETTENVRSFVKYGRMLIRASIPRFVMTSTPVPESSSDRALVAPNLFFLVMYSRIE